MSVRFTTVSLTLPLLPPSSHLKACLPDRLAFHQGRQQWNDTENMHTQTVRYTHRQTDTLTNIHTHIHSHTSFAFLLILAP